MEIIGNNVVSNGLCVENSATAKKFPELVGNGDFVHDASKDDALHKNPLLDQAHRMTHFDEQKWVRDAIAKSMPVARRWAVERMHDGEHFGEFEDEIMEVDSIERRLYSAMKATFLKHVDCHGYDSRTSVFVNKLIEMEEFNKNTYSKLLSKMRKTFVVQSDNRSLEYLISKTTEFVQKVDNIGRAAYEMLKEGNQPNFDSWCTKQAMQDAVFEENKQFLKQSLNHLQALQRYHVKLGVSDIRLLRRQKDGCRREKHYHRAEEWIISIYNSLPANTEQEKAEQAQIYKEICAFIYDIVPLTGRISVNMINFIFDRGFLSPMSRDLLLKIKPRIDALSMTPLFHYPLQRMLEKAFENYNKGSLGQSDWCVLDVAKAYEPKLIPTVLLKVYAKHLVNQDK